MGNLNGEVARWRKKIENGKLKGDCYAFDGNITISMCCELLSDCM
jgi:hypothetical protein